MRRTLVCAILGIVITGLFVSGLAATRFWGGRQWSTNPQIRREQVLFVIVVGSVPLAAYGTSRLLDLAAKQPPPRD